MTVSAGVASLNGGTTALDVFLSMADFALFRAKAAGRNRVELSTSILDSTPRTRVAERDRAHWVAALASINFAAHALASS
jgi:hypothetical protein